MADLVSGLPFGEELRRAYDGTRVLVTGHTGFKGSWLTLWLHQLGADVTGYSLAPTTHPALFEVAGVAARCESHLEDVRDLDRLHEVVRERRPQIVLHLAAQALVRRSYAEPIETITSNVVGTAHVLEAVRRCGEPCAVVVVSSDKCYENRETLAGYREDDRMGGHDVYSMSKGATELVTAAYRRSFFPPERLDEHGVAVASARAGNVVGGGDWAADRIVPDAIGALASGEPIQVRNPQGVRPWQHVLEPLGGYLLLGARLATGDTASRAAVSEAWNFGPDEADARSVRDLVEAMIRAWGAGSWEDRHDPSAHHEAGLLRLNIEKAVERLEWRPRWHFDETIARTTTWYRAFHDGRSPEELAALCRGQIHDYVGG